jgi:hypothetical protein
MIEKNTPKNNKSLRLIIIIAIAVCVAAYIIVFYIPRPIMWNWESIGDYETTMSFISEDAGIEEIMQFDIGVIPVQGNERNIITTIYKDDLEAILKTTKCLRIIKSSPFYYEEYNIITIDISTGKGPLHIIVGEEAALWYRDGGDFFKYSILDRQTFNERLAADFCSINTAETQEYKDETDDGTTNMADKNN